MIKDFAVYFFQIEATERDVKMQFCYYFDSRKLLLYLCWIYIITLYCKTLPFLAFNDQYDTSHLFLNWGVKIWGRYWNKVPGFCHWFLIPAFQKPFLVMIFPCKIGGFDQLLSAPDKALDISRRKWNIIAVKHLLFKVFSDCFDVIWYLFLFFTFWYGVTVKFWILLF